jgi:hypothetical protein
VGNRKRAVCVAKGRGLTSVGPIWPLTTHYLAIDFQQPSSLRQCCLRELAKSTIYTERVPDLSRS